MPCLRVSMDLLCSRLSVSLVLVWDIMCVVSVRVRNNRSAVWCRWYTRCFVCVSVMCVYYRLYVRTICCWCVCCYHLMAGGVPLWAVSPCVVFPPAVYGGCPPPVFCRA